MSTDPEGTPNDSASSHVGHSPGALALLTASALGGIMASRLPKAPLVVAAGVTAFAFLKHKKAVTRPSLPPSPFPPAPPAPERPPHDPVGQWLRKQIEREATAPTVAWPPIAEESAAPPIEEDLYTPQSFLLEDETLPPFSSAHESFACLTEPLALPLSQAAEPMPERKPVETFLQTPPDVSAPPSETPVEESDSITSAPLAGHDSHSLLSPVADQFWEPAGQLPEMPQRPLADIPWPAPASPSSVSVVTLENVQQLTDRVSDPSAPTSPPSDPLFGPATSVPPAAQNVAWLLGIDPVPSLGDGIGSFLPEHSLIITDAPEPPPVFTVPLFQGRSLPDEIEVPPHPPEPGPPVPPPPAPTPPQPEPPAPVPPVPDPPAPAPVPHLVPSFPGADGGKQNTNWLSQVLGLATPGAPLPSHPAFSPADATACGTPGTDVGAPSRNGNASVSAPAAPAPPPSFFAAWDESFFPEPGAAIPGTPIPAPLLAGAQEPTSVESVVEIPVHLATPGEASFDPPPLAAEFWHTSGAPPSDDTAFDTAEPAPAPPPSGPIIDAEIILRPRAPTQNTVTSRTKPLAPVGTQTAPPETPAFESVAVASSSLPSPRDKRPRAPWRSWWRGD